MRRFFFFLPLFALFALLAGCEPGEDPNLVEDCSKRKPAEVIIGTGQYAFKPIDEKVNITFGPQGGAHVWFSLRCRNIGPFAVVFPSIRDVTTGTLLSQPGIKAGVHLIYNAAEEADEAAGIYGYLNNVFVPEDGSPTFSLSDLPGRKVVLAADVQDHCKASSKGELEVTLGEEETQ